MSLGSEVLQVEGLSHAFGGKPVLRNLAFRLREGSLLGLIGPSGGGKSVLLKILGGVYEPQEGQCIWKDELAQSDRSLMFQEGALFDSLSVFDNVAFPLVRGRVPSANLPREQKERVRDAVEEILAKVGLAHAAEKMPGQLSGGMRRRVSLARALVAKPKVLLLDDPTSGLDPVASSVIMKLIKDIHAELHTSVLVVSHDLRRLLPMIDEVACLFASRIVYQGSVQDIPTKAAQEVGAFCACRFDFPGVCRTEVIAW